MKRALLPLLILTTLHAQEEDPYAGISPKQAAVEQMLSERESPEALDKAIETARKQGAGEQAVLEARFLYHVDRREDEKLAAMSPEFLKRRDSFKLSESEIFAVTEDWLAVVEYVQAIAALQKQDLPGFKKHITEAFWLSPKQGSAFASHIERLRLEEAMKKVRVDFQRSFKSLDGKEVSLSSIADGKKALLLHFWSPWSRECEASIADFVVSAKQLEKNGIAVVSLIGEAAPEVIPDTEAIFSSLSEAPPGTWIRDADKASLGQLLRIQNVPMMVLVGTDGRVLFNGHPSENRLWEQLQTVSPTIRRPAVGDGH